MSDPETLNERATVSVWWRVLLGLVGLLVLLIVLGAVGQLTSGSGASSSLKKVVNELDESDPD